MKRYFRGVVGAVVLAFLAVGLPVMPGLVVPSAAADDAPTNGKLLYSGGVLKDLDGADAAGVELAFPTASPSRFSPDGSMIATRVRPCSGAASCQEVVRVHGHDGSLIQPAFAADSIWNLAWSPDQSAVAVVADSGSESYTIWVVPLNGDAARPVLTSSDELKFGYDSLAWRPGSNQIAFVGHDARYDTVGSNFDQIWTVDAVTGAIGLWAADQSCLHGPAVCRVVSYEADEEGMSWSPDGSRIAVYVREATYHRVNQDPDEDWWWSYDGPHDEKHYLATVSAGQVAGTEVYRISAGCDACVTVAANRPIWSADGEDVLFALREWTDTGSKAVTQLVTLAGGALTPVGEPGSQAWAYQDWQPCPTGTCVRWGDSDTADLNLTVTGYDKSTRVGNQDKITATVTNQGPDLARDVVVKVATPKGMFYTDVLKPPGPWSCDQSKKTAVTCKVAELAPGAKASFKVGLLALDVDAKAQLVVHATTKSYDPVAKNDTVRLSKKLTKPIRPKLIKGKAPKVSGACSYPRTREYKDFSWCTWLQVKDKPGLWVKATNLTCTRGGSVGDDGYVAGTLWIWEGGKSGINKLKVNARRQAETYGILKGGERNKSASNPAAGAKPGHWPDDKKNHFTSVSFAWENGGYDAYKVTGNFEWVRRGLYKNIKLNHKVIGNC